MPNELKDDKYDIFAIVNHVTWYLAMPQVMNLNCSVFLTTDPDPHHWNQGSKDPPVITSSSNSYDYSKHNLRMTYGIGALNNVTNMPGCNTSCVASLANMVRSHTATLANITLYDNGVIYNHDCNQYIYATLNSSGTPIIAVAKSMNAVKGNVLQIKKPVWKLISDGIYSIKQDNGYMDYQLGITTGNILNVIFTSNYIPWYYQHGILFTFDKITNQPLYLSISSVMLSERNALCVTPHKENAVPISIYTNGQVFFTRAQTTINILEYVPSKDKDYFCAIQDSNNPRIFAIDTYKNPWDNYSHVGKDFYGQICSSTGCMNSSEKFNTTGIDWKFDGSKNILYYSNPFGLANNTSFPRLDGPVKYCLAKNDKDWYVEECSVAPKQDTQRFIYNGSSLCDVKDKMCYSIDQVNSKLNSIPNIFYNPTLKNITFRQHANTQSVTKPPCATTNMDTKCAMEYCSKVDENGRFTLVEDLDCGNWCSKNDIYCRSIKENFCKQFPTNYLCGCINAGQTPEYLSVKPTIDKIIQFSHDHNIPVPAQTLQNPQCYSTYCALEDLETTLKNKEPCPTSFCTAIVNIKAKDGGIIDPKQLNINIDQDCTQQQAACLRGTGPCDSKPAPPTPPVPSSSSKAKVIYIILGIIAVIVMIVVPIMVIK